MSKKTNITLTTNEDYKVIFQYYVKRLWKKNDDNKKQKFQFHGNCYIWGIDVSKWDAALEASKEVGAKCIFALYKKGDQNKDFTEIYMKYAGQAQGEVNEFTCKDGNKGDGNTALTYDVDTSQKFNCMANTKKSVSSFEGTRKQDGNKGYFMLHYMKEFDPKSVWPDNKDSEDLVMTMDGEYNLDVLVDFTDGTTQTWTDKFKKSGVPITLYDPMAVEDTGDASGAKKLGFAGMTIFSVFVMMVASSF